MYIVMLLYNQRKEKNKMIKYLKKIYILHKIEKANYNYFTITENGKTGAIVIGNKIFQ